MNNKAKMLNVYFEKNKDLLEILKLECIWTPCPDTETVQNKKNVESGHIFLDSFMKKLSQKNDNHKILRHKGILNKYFTD